MKESAFAEPEGPAHIRVVLVETSHPGNIGAAARAMKTMGLRSLHLVAPKTFPCAEATARAAGADDILYHAQVHDDLPQALSGCRLAVATTARSRHLSWPSLSPRQCAERLLQASRGGPVALVFGRESSGLTNRELELCQQAVTIPTDADFRSLNVAAAVQLLGYELLLARLATSESNPRDEPSVDRVTTTELEGFYTHLRQTLVAIGFLDEAAPKLLMRRLRRLFGRAGLDHAELNILRGILSAVDRSRRPQ